MGTVEASTRVAVITVCLDPTSYEAISYFMAGVPGAAMVGNLDHYVNADREIGRGLDPSRARICIIDFDRNTEEATWITDRLHERA